MDQKSHLMLYTVMMDFGYGSKVTWCISSNFFASVRRYFLLNSRLQWNGWLHTLRLIHLAVLHSKLKGQTRKFIINRGHYIPLHLDRNSLLFLLLSFFLCIQMAEFLKLTPVLHRPWFLSFFFLNQPTHVRCLQSTFLWWMMCVVWMK